MTLVAVYRCLNPACEAGNYEYDLDENGRCTECGGEVEFEDYEEYDE